MHKIIYSIPGGGIIEQLNSNPIYIPLKDVEGRSRIYTPNVASRGVGLAYKRGNRKITFYSTRQRRSFLLSDVYLWAQFFRFLFQNQSPSLLRV